MLHRRCSPACSLEEGFTFTVRFDAVPPLTWNKSYKDLAVSLAACEPAKPPWLPALTCCAQALLRLLVCPGCLMCPMCLPACCLLCLPPLPRPASHAALHTPLSTCRR